MFLECSWVVSRNCESRTKEYEPWRVASLVPGLSPRAYSLAVTPFFTLSPREGYRHGGGTQYDIVGPGIWILIRPPSLRTTNFLILTRPEHPPRLSSLYYLYFVLTPLVFAGTYLRTYTIVS